MNDVNLIQGSGTETRCWFFREVHFEGAVHFIYPQVNTVRDQTGFPMNICKELETS